MLRVLVADGDADARGAIRALVDAEVDFSIVGEAADGPQTVRLARELEPDLLLMDVSLPGMDGIAATEAVRADLPDVLVVALSSVEDRGAVSGMIAAGASGYLLKSASDAELLDALRAVRDGRPVLAPVALRGVLADLASLYREQRSRADGLHEIERMKRTFVGLVSDELRTPITAITGYAQTLLRGWDRVDDGTRHEFVERIDSQARHLNRLVEQLLTVALLQRGAVEPAAGSFALDDVAREAVDRFTDHLTDRTLTLDLAPVLVRGDRMAMLSVAVALVENAVEHTAGGVTVRVERDGDMAALTVLDEGEGIDPALVEQAAAQPFVRGGDEHTGRVRGLGLSLYIAQQVLAVGGGRLEVTAPPGGGAAVRALLPA